MSPKRDQRSRPAHGVLRSASEPTIVFVTVCTKERAPWLATKENHKVLRQIWESATAWLVGRYVLMPDHLHLFAAPGELDIELDAWVRYWKSRFRRAHAVHNHQWQSHHWDTRLRREDSYEEKWNYVKENPVRHGLVEEPESWPFQGELNELRW